MLPRFIVAPPRYRRSVDLSEYKSAFRSERGFGMEVQGYLLWALRIAILLYGAMLAFGDLWTE